MNPEDQITEHFRINSIQKAALKRLGLNTVQDLLYYFPTRYGNVAEVQTISSLKEKNLAVIFGKIDNLKTGKGFKTKISMATASISDETGKIKAVWFNQPYIAKMIQEDSMVRIEGNISKRKKDGELYFSNPKIEVVDKVPFGVGDSLFKSTDNQHISHSLYPVYPESRGITTNWIYHAILKVLKNKVQEKVKDPIPEEILKKYSLPSFATSVFWIHTPLNQEDASSAQKRFAFEEIFFIQLEKQKAKREYASHESFKIDVPKDKVDFFLGRLPFKLTEGQKRSIDTIFSDFKKPSPMTRLLEGDVGSGKTMIAAATAYATIETRPKNQNFGRLQIAYMCPTEILADQQFKSFISYFSHLPINIGLITGSGCKKFPSKTNPNSFTDISRSQFLKWVKNGEIHVVVGTHALIQKTVEFKNLAYVIIDEQHRFGTKQRAKLIRKDNIAPHFLSMTATPIPRTLALTVFGDLDLSLLDEMPPGRKIPQTEIIPVHKRKEIYEKIRAEINLGRQAYVILPYIEENEKSVEVEAKRLKKEIFKEFTIGTLHGKMASKRKEDVMNDFKNKKIDILCATSVIEVGVNVPNANIIIIEGAERFGLAQLHQLRGRVIRGEHQPYCYIFSDSESDKTKERLQALASAKNGFELAEKDLQIRGTGSLTGTKQWGVSDIAMEALKNLKMVEAARIEANNVLDEPEKYPDIIEKLKNSGEEKVHFE